MLRGKVAISIRKPMALDEVEANPTGARSSIDTRPVPPSPTSVAETLRWVGPPGHSGRTVGPGAQYRGPEDTRRDEERKQTLEWRCRDSLSQQSSAHSIGRQPSEQPDEVRSHSCQLALSQQAGCEQEEVTNTSHSRPGGQRRIQQFVQPSDQSRSISPATSQVTREEELDN